jgi:hypothetical protein
MGGFTWAVPATIHLDFPRIRLAQIPSPCVITEKAILGQWLAVSFQPLKERGWGLGTIMNPEF